MAPLEETIAQPPAATAPIEDNFGESAEADPVEAPIVVETAQPAEPAAPPVAMSEGGFRLVMRLQDGERVEIGEFKDFGTAMEAAQEVIEQFTTAADGTWPFYAGRFIRPDLIVSVDLVEAGTD